MQDDFRGMRMDTKQLELLVTKIIHEQLLYNGYFYGVLLVLMIVGGAIVWFAAPYLKSRGQAFATKADFAQLFMQLKKTTATTETIRAVISLENWGMKEHKALRRLKLEELVLAIHECEHWLSQHASYRLFGQDTVLSADPVAKGMSSANDSEQDDHDSDHQKYVNETTEGVGSDQSKKPQDEQNNGNRIEHGY